MKLDTIARKVMAVAVFLVLLPATMPALAESLFVFESQICCTTSYCPMHHHQGREMSKDKSDCGSQGNLALAGSSVRACDTPSNQAVGTPPFLLTAPATISYKAAVQAAPLSSSRFVPVVLSLPSTPPPRTFPS